MSDTEKSGGAARRSPETEWERESKRWQGVVLEGRFGHYCNEWDGLPIDETCDEFGVCGCLWNPPEERAAKDAAVEAARARYEASAASDPEGVPQSPSEK